MAGPFVAAGRAEALRRLIGSILSGEHRGIARQDMLEEIERRQQQERWQRGTTERGLGLEERRVAEAERAGPAGEALAQALEKLREEGAMARHLAPSGTALLPYERGETPAQQAERESRERTAEFPYTRRTAESEYMFGTEPGALTPPVGVPPGTAPGLWGEYVKPPAPMQGGFAGLPEGPIDPRTAELMLEWLRHTTPSGGERLRASITGERDIYPAKPVDDLLALVKALKGGYATNPYTGEPVRDENGNLVRMPGLMETNPELKPLVETLEQVIRAGLPRDSGPPESTRGAEQWPPMSITPAQAETILATGQFTREQIIAEYQIAPIGAALSGGAGRRPAGMMGPGRGRGRGRTMPGR